MRLHRFYLTEEVGTKSEIKINSVELIDQIRKVFRLKTGDSVVIFDSSGFDYECTIAGIEKEGITLSVKKMMRSRFMPSINVYLFASVVKKDTFEWIVEKATELGVTHIIPVISERSEKKNLNENRLKKIAIEASEQSGRGNVPKIFEVQTIEKGIQYISEINLDKTVDKVLQKIAFHTSAPHISVEDLGKDCDTAIFIGPEGGWSEREIEMFHKNKIEVVSIGNQVLRAETAVVSALSLILLGK